MRQISIKSKPEDAAAYCPGESSVFSQSQQLPIIVNPN